MSIIGSNILAGASGQGGGYTIERSLRFRSSASAYLSRTPASAGNRKTWTWSGWVKRGILSSSQALFSAKQGYSSTSRSLFKLDNSDNTLAFLIYDDINGYSCLMNTGIPLLRDPSAWYHIVIAYDSTQATASNRVKIYWNNTQYTFSGSPIYPSLNLARDFNASVGHYMGADVYNSASYLDGYLTEINFIDGQALDPLSFGEYNEDTGVWQPIKYSGTYGTNGFYLPFSDNTTTTTLAADASGNGNDWTPNNISLTSGVTYDSMTDTPTPYADGGNYAVLNPIATLSGGSGSATWTNGNLTFGPVQAEGSAQKTAIATIICPSTGKWYWEMTPITLPSTASRGGVGIMNVASLSDAFQGASGSAGAYSYHANGYKSASPSDAGYGAYGASYTTSDVIGVALDMDAGTLTFYKNGTSQGTAYSGLSGEYYPAVGYWITVNANFGQRPFAYTPPTGFLPLHTGNLPDSAIVDGSKYFNTVLYTGNGSTNNITGVGFQPDFVWLKARSAGGFDHVLQDVIRGSTYQLYTNTTDAEVNDTDAVTSFNSDGFTSGADVTTNNSGTTYVAWNWKANGAGVSNTDGSITSTVSANPTAGFSIVQFTGNGTDGATVGHGLNSAPEFSIIKNRDTTTNWDVTFEGISGGTSLNLDTPSDVFSPALGYHQLGATTLTLKNGGSGIERVNTNTQDYIAYCFSSVEGYSKFGSYTGNGSSDGVFVHLNFRPAFVIIKRTDVANGWNMYDSKRDPYNVALTQLVANSSDAETTNIYDLDLTSNGFKLRRNATGLNASGGTYIYMAFAETDFAHALAR